MSQLMQQAAPPVAITRTESFAAFRAAASSSFVPLNITALTRAAASRQLD